MSDTAFLTNKKAVDILKEAGIIPPDMNHAVKIVLTVEVHKMPIVEVWYLPETTNNAAISKKSFELKVIEDNAAQ